MDGIKNLYNLLGEFVHLFDEMIVLENNKLDAIALNNIPVLEQYMKDEQAFAMKLKGLELKREKAQAECGFEGLTLKTVIERLDGEDKNNFYKIYTLLENKTQEFKDVLSCADKYVELHLLGLERMLAEPARQNIGYDSKGEIKKNEKGKNEFKSKKI